jgi:hypothetical protein
LVSSHCLFVVRKSNPPSRERNWERIAAPEDYGYAGVKLNALRTWLKTLQTKGLLVRSAVAYSSTMATRIMLVSKIASTRKSVLDMLYGNIVANGKVDPQKTVKDIGLEEVRKFLPVEENPTLEMQLMSRSAIYQFTNEEPVNQAPRIGSQYPGTFLATRRGTSMRLAQCSRN